jgi:hypothetical protein
MMSVVVPGPVDASVRDALHARFGPSRQTGWRVDGVLFDTYQVTLGPEQLPEPIQREVELRRIALGLEEQEAAQAWAEAHPAREEGADGP